MNFFASFATRNRIVSILIACFACAATPVSAEILAYWNPAGTVDSNSPLPPTTVSAHLSSAGNLTGGPGLTSPGPFANAYEFDNWPSGALDTSDYLAFSATGNNISYSNVQFSLYNNFDGSGNWEIRSSVDGYTAALDSGTFSGIGFSGELITANVASLGVRSGEVQFHLYTYSNAGDTNPLQRGIRGTGGEGQGLTINGSASAGPAPSVSAAPAVGVGRWLLLAALLVGAWQRLSIRKKTNR